MGCRDPEGKVKEFHLTSFGDGCYSNNPAVLPKNTWTYLPGVPAPSACTISVPKVDSINCTLHQATNHVYNCTPKANGQPILPEGHPERQVCELKAMGWASPTFFMSGGLQVVPQRNPMLVAIKGSGTGTLTCKIPAQPGLLCNLQVTQ
jgi:hypothetical protein